MTAIAGDRTLGDIVAERSAAARVLDRLGLDYCCHGDHSLAHACSEAGLDVGVVAAELAGLAAEPADGWAQLSAPELADHIVATHHRYLREELPLLTALAAKVYDVHGARHGNLSEVRLLVAALRAELEPHLDREERVLFPAVHAIAAGRRDFVFGSITNPIRVMMSEHDSVGELLAQLRAAATDYSLPEDACASYRSLFERLQALEADTHVHIHKENHVLFPAVRRAFKYAERAGASAPISKAG